MAAIKTNVIRILDKEKIHYTCSTYEVKDGKIDGIAVAHKIGIDEKQVFKTLLVQGKSKTCYVCVIPVAKELDFKKISILTKEKSIEMLPVNDLQKTTGYIRGGCSPIGMKKLFKTFIDETVTGLEYITFSAGKLGVQVTIQPKDLISLIQAEVAELTH
nr:Cys-tRNA(Pro) deacylase [uncultured Niameybacter sp.]